MLIDRKKTKSRCLFRSGHYFFFLKTLLAFGSIKDSSRCLLEIKVLSFISEINWYVYKGDMTYVKRKAFQIWEKACDIAKL